MAIWYGKGCSYQVNQWEDNEFTGGPNYKDSTPALIYCTHKGNPKDSEGNCHISICPIKFAWDGKKVEFKTLKRHLLYSPLSDDGMAIGSGYITVYTIDTVEKSIQISIVASKDNVRTAIWEHLKIRRPFNED